MIHLLESVHVAATNISLLLIKTTDLALPVSGVWSSIFMCRSVRSTLAVATGGVSVHLFDSVHKARLDDSDDFVVF